MTTFFEPGCRAPAGPGGGPPIIPKRALINDALEAATGVDQWGADGPDRAQLYTTLLTHLEETPR